ncbi:MAG: DUF3105 domain-containing protein [Actinomycetota bacterium]|nr:DUF3105 domain-containing protein [Actinomycetota bacterium]
MASGSSKKKSGKNAVSAARSSVVSNKGKPWGTIAAIVAVVLLAVGVIGYAVVQVSGAEKFTASEDNKDPSVNIPGVVRTEYTQGQHVTGEQRVDYDQSPPYGGPHDQAWADCTGIVYPVPVRTENMIHTLEHGAVWIAYNPDKVQGGDLDKLKAKVEGQPYMSLSPYPGLDKPFSMQSWGHQLKLENVDDERVDQFIKALRSNNYQNPEPGARCDTNQTGFDPANPPPFIAEKPGPDAIGMDGKGAVQQAPGDQPIQPPAGTGAPVPPGIPGLPTGAPAPGQ